MGVAEQTNQKSNRLSFLYEAALSILFFLAGLNAFGVRGVFFLLAFGLESFRQFFLKKIKVSVLSLAILAFFVALTSAYFYHYSFSFLQLFLLCFIPFLAFTIGSSDSRSAQRFFVFFLVASALGYGASIVTNLIASTQMGATFRTDGISFYFDYQLQKESARPFVSIGLIPLLSLGSAALFLGTRKRWTLTGLLGVIAIGFGLATNAWVGNRSFLLIAPVTLIVLLFFLSFKSENRKTRKAFFTFLLILVAFAVIGSIFYIYNLAGFRDLLLKIPAFSRFADKTGSGRSYQYDIFFREWLNYPFGGMTAAHLFELWGINFELHNAFLQVYSIGGWLPFILEGTLLLFWIYLIFATKITKANRIGVITSTSFSIAFFAICLFEPMITSEPFICSTFFLCAGYLYGEWARQRNRKPLLSIGLSHNGGPSLNHVELFGKLTIALGLIASTAVLSVFSDYGAVFSVISLLLLVSGFALLDKADYSVLSTIKTILCLILSASFTIFLNIYLPTNTWMYSLAKAVLSIAIFIFLRIIVVSKNEEKDGYYRLRNFFTKLARDIDGSPEENLVSQDLQTNNEGE